jgi:aspartyl-tRNA(Asn)/glutamyl-tRNA(Gln) amidotransferase subunit A
MKDAVGRDGELWRWPATAIAAAVRAGQVSATDVTESALARIDEIDPQLNAFLRRMEGAARAAAGRIDLRRRGGETDTLGPLAGVPVAIKDNICTAGVPTTCGSRILEGYSPAYDATAIERLATAGAVVVGKTNMDEFGMGSSGESSAFGPTRNPWDPTRVPGGSSSGSAAAVASGLVPLALGSDTGGSVRQPGALCGLLGLKPTYGRVSRFGLVAFASSLDQIGLLGRTVDDIEAALRVIAGHDRRDSTSHPEADRFQGGAELASPPRIGVPFALLEEGLDSDTAALLAATVTRLGDLGAEVRELTLPRPDQALAAYYIVANAEASANLARYDGVRYGLRHPEVGGGLDQLYERSRSAGFGFEVKRRILLGTYALSSGYYDDYYLRAQKARSLFRQDFAARLAEVDAILIPTSPTVAFRLGERIDDPLAMYLSDLFTIPANLAGLPALSLPAGLGTETRLPVGVQLIGRPFAEETLLDLARRLEPVANLAAPG